MSGVRIRTGFVMAVFFIAALSVFGAFASPALAQMGMGGGMGSGGMGSGGTGGSGSGGHMGGNPVGVMGSMTGMMLVSGGTPYRPDGRLLDMNDAVNIASRYLSTSGVQGLALDEVEEWEFNYYVVVKEAAPSQYKAFQLIIDKLTGFIMPEPGPGMMWNLKYGRMMNQTVGSMTGGMMGGMTGGMMSGRPKKNIDPTMTVSAESAAAAANQFLQDRFGPSKSLVVEGAPDTFYGYYNFDVKDVATGNRYGMLSVNGTSGQVWYHTWHGSFIQSRELN